MRICIPPMTHVHSCIYIYIYYNHLSIVILVFLVLDCGKQVELFSSRRINTGLDYLRVAMDTGHLGASYLLGMISVLSGVDECIERGIQLLTYICSIDRAKECREKLSLAKNGEIWLIHNNWFVKGTKPTLCSKQHQKRIGWSSEYEYFEDENCKACRCDVEISFFCDRFCRNN